MATQAERSARTRGALLAAARELFAERGFAQVGREDIAERAGVTRGALYHHFASKADVAAAVVEELEAELVERIIAAAAKGKDRGDQLRRSCRAYLDACTEPTTARLLLVEGPAVLGPERTRELTETSCARLLGAALHDAAGDGLGVPGDPDVAARLLIGMLNEAATLVASAPDRAKERARVGPTVNAFLAKLLAS